MILHMSRCRPFCTNHTRSTSLVGWSLVVYVECPLHVDPRDHPVGGRRDPNLHIRVDTSLCAHPCVGGPFQKTL